MITRRGLLAAVCGIGLVVVCGVAVAQTSKCKLGRIAEWPLRPDRDHLIVDGAINGQPVAIILDTGAGRTLILRAAAERLGLPRQELKNLTMYGVGGPTKAEAAFVDEFKVGDATSRNMRMLVASGADFGADVFLGEDFFRMVDVEFDLAHNMVRLYQSQNCDGVSLAYWASAGAGEVEIEPVDEVYPQIILTVEVNGKPIKAMFDSGAPLSVLGKPDAAGLGVTPETPGVIPAGRAAGVGSKTVHIWLGPFQSFTIGNETIRNTEIRFADLFKSATYSAVGTHIPMKVEGLHSISMLLGADFLRSHRVLVAHSQRRIYFTYNGGPVFRTNRPPAPRDSSPTEAKAAPGATD